MKISVVHRCPNCGEKIEGAPTKSNVVTDTSGEQVVGREPISFSVVWACESCGRIDGETIIVEPEILESYGSFDWVGTVEGEECYIGIEADDTHEVEDFSVESVENK